MTTEQTPTTVPAPQEQKEAEKPTKAAASPAKQNKAPAAENAERPEPKSAKAESKPHPKSAKQKKRGDPKTPKPKNKDASDKKGGNTPSTAKSSNQSNSASGKRHHKHYAQKQRNFYNPPQKVLRHLAQQSQYDSFYGNQGQFYTLKQKYKTQLCRHFLESGKCALEKYCQFAHGSEELRQPNDPLPKNFGKTALGAVHSNYKTIPCKYWLEAGKPAEFSKICKFGENCSFYHGDEDMRRLTDPLPNLPEGITLPPMSAKVQFKHRRNYHGRHHNSARVMNDGQDWSNQPGFFPNQGVSQFLQLTNIADIAAIGGFNPDKYLSGPPPPQPVYQFTAPEQVFEQTKATEECEKDESTEMDKIDEATAETQPIVQAIPEGEKMD